MEKDISLLNVLLLEIVANLMSEIQGIPCESAVVWAPRVKLLVRVKMFVQADLINIWERMNQGTKNSLCLRQR